MKLLIKRNELPLQQRLTMFWFICSVFMSIVLLNGCKKDLSPAETYQALNSLAKTNSTVEEIPSLVVHKNSSIQAAVDAASPGAVIHIEPGIYYEKVVVNKRGIKLIGLGKNENHDNEDDQEDEVNGSSTNNDEDRQGVIIQNPGNELNGITVTHGDGFVLKNVTVKNFKENGVALMNVDGFLLSHVTAINNGEYGLFPVFSKNGVIEHCTATGHADTGIYVGQSTNIEVDFNRAFANVNGLEIENSSNASVSHNKCYNNVCGILVVVLPGLQVKTTSNITVNNNHVYNNNHVNFSKPGDLVFFVPTGSGILIVGPDNTMVRDNKINGNHFVGIAAVSTLILGALAGLPPSAFSDIEPNPDGLRILNNNLIQNGTAPPIGLPLPGADLLWDGSGLNNCWSQNIYTTSFPSTLASCN